MAKAVRIETNKTFSPGAKTKVTSMGNITELLTLERKARGSPCIKKDKDHYCDKRTGEILEYKHFDNRADSRESVRQTLCRIRALINTNVSEPKNCRWVTLTYAENMTDTVRLYDDYKKFWKRFLRFCKNQNWLKPEYITVQEPQSRGAWHIHAFFIWPTEAPFIPNDDLERIWGQGFTKVKAVNDCDNIGAYFSAYLADLPVDESDSADMLKNEGKTVEEKEFVDDDGLTKRKQFIKGGRLWRYPAGMNIVRTTRGVKKPLVDYMTLEEAKEKVSCAKETFSRTYEILDDSGAVLNTICKSYYNSKRR